MFGHTIHPCIFWTASPIQCPWELEPIPAVTGHEPPYTLAFTPTANLESPISLTCMWECERKLDTWKEPTQAQGEHANFPKTPQHWCVVTVLTTVNVIVLKVFRHPQAFACIIPAKVSLPNLSTHIWTSILQAFWMCSVSRLAVN